MPISLPSPVIAIAAGFSHTCAVTVDGAASCWGANSNGQVGDGAPAASVDVPSDPLALPPGTTVSAIALGSNHTCALLSNDRAACWGVDTTGQLGNGVSTGDVVTPPGSIVGTVPVLDSSARSVDAGYAHTCAVLVDGGVSCWGLGDDGRLGYGSTTSYGSPPAPVTLPGGRTATAVGTGYQHSCALLDDGTVSCWGNNAYAQLGVGSAGGSMSSPTGPIAMPSGRVATVLAVGGYHACVVLADGAVACWGLDGNGQSGNGDATSSPVLSPALVALPARATDITAGDYHTCALLEGGAMSCWGDDSSGQIGNGAQTGNVTSPGLPIAMPGGATAIGVTAGAAHTCALLDTGTVTCWGADAQGQLGNGATGPLDAPSGTVAFGADRLATSIAAGAAHTCAALGVDGFACWGDDGGGQLGNSDFTTVDLPVSEVVNYLDMSGVTGVVAGAFHTCGVSFEGTVRCWGADAGGQLGDGGINAARSTPSDELALVGQLVVAEPPPAPIATGSALATIRPARLLDTRPGQTTIDGLFQQGGKVSGGTAIEVPIAGRGGIPYGAVGAVLNVTVTEPDGIGYATVYPCSAQAPVASTLNYLYAGHTIPNLTVTKLSPTGTVCVFTRATTHLVIDATGFLPAASPVTPIEPARLLDTRPGESTIDGLFEHSGKVSGGARVEVQVAGRGGIPADAATAILNVTVTEPDDLGYATVYPCTAEPPVASTLNYTYPGHTVPNAAIAKLSPTGSVCVFTRASAHIVVDATGYLPPGTPIGTIEPARLLDTRPGQTTVDGVQQGSGAAIGGTVLEVQVTGRAGIPTTARTAVLNVTVTEPTDVGYATVYPCAGQPPVASTLNYQAGQTVPNAAVVQLSATGAVCIFTRSTTHLLVDAAGYS